MIGNDIIDLSISLSSKKQENTRYLKKVFSEGEINTIKTSKHPEMALWQFWSMKEAAYKAHQRKFNLSRKLNPLQYICSLDPKSNSGFVRTNDQIYPVHTEVSEKYIHSSVHSEQNFQKIYYNDFYSEKKLLQNLASVFSLDEAFVSLLKNCNGIPSIHLKNEDKILPISLSHHGNFTAFVIPLINS
ncbi:4'-phosphopantetheinyl transferase superfamily protein [Gramella sp. MAR_2010_147]|uniref:4'-phosphopantetheinyl transferase superfamily protein n=1 Tax=Gramella sp. MAR_2010_147 TaxID=1250205 RepID=UPI00087D9A28|nr:4'-phosphopantetheinyl transferase superfamily protein [Gramella sp. MAR_2010_147]SDR79200.1 phosphopantetheine--protein transferase domain-containing protein [Gramella sp. MAR_2010_147]